MTMECTKIHAIAHARAINVDRLGASAESARFKTEFIARACVIHGERTECGVRAERCLVRAPLVHCVYVYLPSKRLIILECVVRSSAGASERQSGRAEGEQRCE